MLKELAQYDETHKLSIIPIKIQCSKILDIHLYSCLTSDRSLCVCVLSLSVSVWLSVCAIVFLGLAVPHSDRGLVTKIYKWNTGKCNKIIRIRKQDLDYFCCPHLFRCPKSEYQKRMLKDMGHKMMKLTNYL